MGMQPILPVTVPIKKIKGATRQRYVVTLGVNRPLSRYATHADGTVHIRIHPQSKTLMLPCSFSLNRITVILFALNSFNMKQFMPCGTHRKINQVKFN